MKPAALRSNGTIGQGVGSGLLRIKDFHDSVDDATASAAPLLAAILHAAPGKAKPRFRRTPFLGSVHEFLVDFNPIAGIRDAPIRQDDAQQNRSVFTARTGAENR